jgi:ABC-type transport system involved in multi-copper enzyme maturation permease subunit
MFWFIVGIALFLMCILTPLLPYFTFGEDYKMVQELGYGIIMLAAGCFGILNASMSISEEIEGRTAVTLMSKPVSRRQFLLGKFLGIVGVCLFMTAVLSWFYDGSLLMKLQYLNTDQQPMPSWPTLDSLHGTWATKLGDQPGAFLYGGAWWFFHVLSVAPGIVLGFGQAMILVAIAVALATRLPMIVNIVCCTVIFFLGNLTPVLAQISQNRYPLIKFMAQVFGSILPGLDFFNLGGAITRETPLPAGDLAMYVGTVSFYAVLYTGVALLLGLILFEDRDLA